MGTKYKVSGESMTGRGQGTHRKNNGYLNYTLVNGYEDGSQQYMLVNGYEDGCKLLNTLVNY